MLGGKMKIEIDLSDSSKQYLQNLIDSQAKKIEAMSNRKVTCRGADGTLEHEVDAFLFFGEITLKCHHYVKGHCIRYGSQIENPSIIAIDKLKEEKKYMGRCPYVL